jgi:5,10-methenyltetrahydrofolate synthetase
MVAPTTTALGQEASAALRERKQALRRQTLAARAALDPAEHLRLSLATTARLLGFSEIEGARCVLAYLSFGSEFDTQGFVRALLARGCRLVLPRIDLANRRLTLHRVTDPEGETVAGVWGIQEPDPGRCPVANPGEIEAVLVPGVAFTPHCERLGYGGGFYDKLIREWPAAPPLIAAAFPSQVVDDLPIGPDDRPVDAVVTEGQIYRRRPS